MKKLFPLLLAAALLFSGCGGWMEGEYLYTEPHTFRDDALLPEGEQIDSYGELCDALAGLVYSGATREKVAVAKYDRDTLKTELDRAIREMMQTDAVAAYIAENITYDLGNAERPETVHLYITYHPNRRDIHSIQEVTGMEQAQKLLYGALDRCDGSIVLKVADYEETDFALLVQSYADRHPELVMECPQVTANLYPAQGKERVVELVFTYQNSRNDLRAMAEYVAPVVQASYLNVVGEEDARVRFSLMYAFLMERNTIRLDRSSTPAYSVLRYGVGDSKAFAQVFAALCANADMDCMVVVGTRNGEPHFWNMVGLEERYYHVDILRQSQSSELEFHTDGDMVGYVWDFDAYPPCTAE